MTFSITSSFFKKHLKIFIYFFLIVITCIVYQNIHKHDFINYDDQAYVADNSQIQKGLSFQNIAWAFSFSKKAIEFYWHPVTKISHMADCQFFGTDAGMHHLINGFLHLLNALLLFTICYHMTSTLWQSAFVAAVFAVHPINVESVAWISERKNVLSTLFWMLSMAAYLYYARRPGIRRYLLLLVPFIFGLMTKPMLVTLPCVFLLLDFWPLGRLTIFSASGRGTAQTDPPALQSAPIPKLIAEKLPLLMISFLSVGISLLSAHMRHQIISAENIPLALRLENAIVSYVKYIGKLVWPRDMAIYYPFPEAIPIGQVIAAIVFLSVITLLSVRLIKKAPYVIVGWLWYLGTLFPVIGISQHGRWPEMADRWMYVPEIGLLIIISWGGAALLSKIPHPKRVIAPLALMIIAALVFSARNQAAYWQNSQTLFEHALNVTENNDLAHNNLGTALQELEHTDEAIFHFLQALRINPDFELAHVNIGNSLNNLERTEEAVFHYQQALRIKPDYADAHYNLGIALTSLGQTEESINHYRQALKINPDYGNAHYNLGVALSTIGLFEDAIHHFKQSLKIDPDLEDSHFNLGVALYKTGQTDEAIRHYQEAIAINPDNAMSYYSLAVAFYRKGDMTQAIKHLQTAVKLNPDYTPAKNLLKRLQNMQISK